MFTSFIKGVLVGGGVFGTLALLYTPHSGKENRRRTQQYAKDIEIETRSLTQSAADLQNAFADLSEQSAATLTKVQKSLADIGTHFIDQSEPQLLRLKARIQQLKDDLGSVKDEVDNMKEN